MIRSLFIALIVVTACTPATTRLSGTVLEGKMAPDFTLADGVSGETVTLSSLRGSVVVLAFLYTRCPDVCPLTAGKMRAAQKILGVDGYAYVAVSVDPDGDTPASVRAFSEAHDLRLGWRYLIGPRSQLRAVWAAYGIGAFPGPTSATVDHNDAMYVIDRKGREREILHSDVALADLVADLRAIGGER